MLTNPKTGKVSLMKNSILFMGIVILSGCEGLSFTNEDSQSAFSEKELERDKENREPNILISSAEDAETETNPPDGKKPFLEKEITLISEDLELTEDTVIRNRKVVLDMAKIKTFEHDLLIVTEEFVSNHSIIQNFPEEQKAERGQDGRSGGNILIEAQTAKGELQLILNGEKAGSISRFRTLSNSESSSLKGQNGEDGHDAVYTGYCLEVSDFQNGLFSRSKRQMCWEECVASPTRGSPGGDGYPGLPGFDGRNGGKSGSFHLKAFELSDFHLTDIKQNPGTGSKGSEGSLGGAGGKRGKNGKDEKNLCNHNFPRSKNGKRGERGPKGKDGENGKKGAVCLEKLLKEKSGPFESEEPKKESVICY